MVASALSAYWCRGLKFRETYVSRSLAITDQMRKRQLILARTMLLSTPNVKSVEKFTTLSTTYLFSQPDHPLLIANTITADNTITSSLTICLSRFKSVPIPIHEGLWGRISSSKGTAGFLFVQQIYGRITPKSWLWERDRGSLTPPPCPSGPE